MRTSLSCRLAIDCMETDLLFHVALDRAKAAGQTVGAYNEARRRSPHEMVFDVETVVRAALADAGCRLTHIEWERTGDRGAYDRAVAAPGADTP